MNKPEHMTDGEWAAHCMLNATTCRIDGDWRMQQATWAEVCQRRAEAYMTYSSAMERELRRQVDELKAEVAHQRKRAAKLAYRNDCEVIDSQVERGVMLTREGDELRAERYARYVAELKEIAQ